MIAKKWMQLILKVYPPFLARKILTGKVELDEHLAASEVLARCDRELIRRRRGTSGNVISPI